MQLEIRNATGDDRDAIVAFDHVARLEHTRVELIGRFIRETCCLVAERNGGVVGYGALEYTFYQNGFVSMVYVAEPERRRGIGRALLEALVASCQTPKLFVSTNQSNHGMQTLLGQLGFVSSGVIHNLDPGDPELVYFLEVR